MKRIFYFVLVCVLSACSVVQGMVLVKPTLAEPTATEAFTATLTPFLPAAATETPQPTPTLRSTDTPTLTASPTRTASPTLTLTLPPTITPSPSATPSSSPTASPTWESFPAGKVTAPILLYHHINEPQADSSRYFVTAGAFEGQMQALHDWGYTPVTVGALVDILVKGGKLPARPAAITFDDGNADVYQNAFPIMRKYGYPGTFFIVANRLGSKGYVGIDELKEMVAAGWEIGSHSMTHADLLKNPALIPNEAGASRKVLEDALQTHVNLFAYPFGVMNGLVWEKVRSYGYRAAVGLGGSYYHSMGTLYYLSRIEVQNSFDLDQFAKILPWSGGVP